MGTKVKVDTLKGIAMKRLKIGGKKTEIMRDLEAAQAAQRSAEAEIEKLNGKLASTKLNLATPPAADADRRRLGWKPSHDIPRRREGFHHTINRVIRESE